ncbi:MAG: hypothetical protein K2N89_00230, partial [Lachnospiraceae bacterium]|nr:hypothetical protein [Lachnospiraceae bacterium]
ASGIALKYTEGFEEKSGKYAAIVTQFKTKTSKLKFGTDYTLNVKKASDNTDVVLNDKGQLPLTAGTYKLRIEGKDNYTGIIEKELYVASKSQLMKNAKITCDSTVSNVTKEELKAGIEPQNLQVSMGGALLTKDTDYEVLCSNNNAIGTATVTVKGKNNYFGSKSITFKINGTTFKEKEFGAVAVKDMTYTGEALTQNDVLLTKNGTSLIYGEDYTISYQNNIKKGKATMVFTAKPSSGYSGSFKKTFSIGARDLSAEDIENYIRITGGQKQADTSWKLIESVPYRKSGATPSDKIVLQSKTTGEVLTEGKGGSYTVTYSDNKTLGMGVMTLKGIGNYTGSIKVSFDIEKASIARLYREGKVSVTAALVKVGFDYSKSWVPPEDDEPGYWKEGDLKDPGRKIEPAITVKDAKTKLKEGVDFDVSYLENTRSELEKSGRLTAVITGKGDYGASGEEIKISVTVNRKALSGKSIQIKYEDERTYTGMPIEPQITEIFYNDGKDEDGDIIWQKLVEGEDYTLEYSKNILKGSGTIKIIGIGNYSGSVTKKFKINSKEIYAQR